DEYLEHAWDGLLDVDLYTTVHFEAVFNFSSGEGKFIYTNSYSQNNFFGIYVKPATDKLVVYTYMYYGTTKNQWRWETNSGLSDGVHHIAVQHTNGSDPIIEIDGVAAPFTAAWSLNNKTRTTS
ncbi:hypothetical protein D1BOALGB6SA_1064, partial [Olavius sp. associated proteobacterium Delta 1]